ncbi:MAG: TonB-dependent receptor [Niabella sp.]|nr:TonB-dependent receptor [Niabella sp.]
MNKGWGFMLAMLLLGTLGLSAQDISGTVKNGQGAGLGNVTVALIKEKDSSAVKYALTDTSGRFIFEKAAPGSYIIRASHTTYITQFSDIFWVRNEMVTVPSIVLYKDAKELQSVTVNNTKPLLERKVDRLVFNVENSIAARGSSLEEALRITPMLQVKEDGISMIGKGGLRVMINDRMVYLSGADLMQYLRSLRSDDVAQIEVITSPPAKYSAAGNSGLINIVLKKNPLLGWSGAVGATYSQGIRAGFNDNFTLNYRSARISSSLKLRQNVRRGFTDETADQVGTTFQILNSFPRATSSSGVGANLTLDYKLNNKNNLGFIYDVNTSDYKIDQQGSTTYQTNRITDSVLFTPSYTKQPATTHTLNVYHDFKIDTLGKLLNTSFSFFSNGPESRRSFTTTSSQSSMVDQVINNSNAQYNVWALQSDVTLPYKWAKLETGAKYTYFDNTAANDYYNLSGTDYVSDTAKSDRYNYAEQNIAAYISTEKRFNKQWSAKAGLRYEYAVVDGFSPTTKSGTNYAYGKLFPTAYVTYKLNDINTFSLNYSKRINRPSLGQINPRKLYTNPYSYYVGNPLLQPSYSHNIELSYLYKSMLSFTVFGQRTLNGAGSIIKVDGSSVVISSANYLTQNNFGAYASFNYKIFKWWENNSSVSYSGSSSQSSLQDIVVKSGAMLNYGTNNTFILTKWLRYFLSASYMPGNTRANVYTYGQYYVNSGFRASFVDSKLLIGLSFLDGSKNRYRLYYKDFTQYTNTNYHYRTFSLNVSYLFGKPKVKENGKRVDFRETQRAN